MPETTNFVITNELPREYKQHIRYKYILKRPTGKPSEKHSFKFGGFGLVFSPFYTKCCSEKNILVFIEDIYFDEKWNFDRFLRKLEKHLDLNFGLIFQIVYHTLSLKQIRVESKFKALIPLLTETLSLSGLPIISEFPIKVNYLDQKYYLTGMSIVTHPRISKCKITLYHPSELKFSSNFS